MSPEERQIESPGGNLQWLQDEIHNVKVQAGKLEQEVEQLQALLSDLVERTRHHDEAFSNLNVQLAILTQLQDEARELQTLTSRLRDEQERARGHVEESTRQQQAEGERVRSERAELVRQVQDLERQVASWLERQGSIEETGRRYQESAATTAQQTSDLQQRVGELEGRSARNLEAMNRLDQKLPELNTGVEAALRGIEATNERTRLLADVVHRIEGEIADLTQRVGELNELPERIELARVERQRLEARFALVEEAVDGLSGSRDEHQRLLSALEGKHHGYEGRLDALMTRLDEYREQLAEHLLKLTQNQEQLKRRQIGDLEREIKELQQHALGLFHE
jgi:chromosome segregation ATPase